MAISFVGAGASSTGTNITALAVPSGVQKNDLLLIVCTSILAGVTPAAPSGWTSLAAQGSGQFIVVFSKFASASESNVALSPTGSASRAVMLAYRGAGGVEVRPAFSAVTATTIATNTFTTTYNNDYVVSIYANANGGARTWTAPGSTTTRSNNATSSTINGLLIVDELQAVAGTTTARTATISLSSSLSAIAIGIIEDNRSLYWVGGNGTWDATSTTNWSNTSGGPGGAEAPSSTDNAIIDANSGSPTVTLTGAPVCKSLTTTGATCTLSSTGSLTVNGSMTLSSTTTWTATGRISLIGAGTITTNGVSLTSPLTLNAISETVTLNGNLTTTGTIPSFNLLAGTLDLSTSALNADSFGGTGTVARSIAFGSGSAINLNGSTGFIWNCQNVTNFSTTGTPTVNRIGTGSVFFNHGGTSGLTETTARVDFNISSGTLFEFVSDSGMRNLNFTGYSGTFERSTFFVYGSLTASPTMTVTGASSGDTITFRSTSTGNTITTAGKFLSNSFIFNGVGGTWDLQDNLFVSALFSLTAGSINSNNYNIDASALISSGNLVRSLSLGSSTVTVDSSSSIAFSGTNFTFNAGTSQINATNDGNTTFSGNNQTFYNVNFSSESTVTIVDSNTFNTISFDPIVGSSTTLSFTAGTTQTVTNFIFDGSSVGEFVTIRSTSTVTAATLSKSSGTVNLVNARIGAVAATGGATWNAFTCQKQSALATGWNFDHNRYLVGGAGPSVVSVNFLTSGVWSRTSGGTKDAQPPFIFDTAILDANSNYLFVSMTSSSVGTLLVTTDYPGASATAALRQGAGADFNIYGSFLILKETAFDTFAANLNYNFRSTSAGNEINIAAGNLGAANDYQFFGVGGEYTLQSDLTNIGYISLEEGTLNTNSFNISGQRVDDANGSNPKTLNLANSTIEVSFTWITSNANTTVNAGTSTIKIFPTTDTTAFDFTSTKTLNNVIIDRPACTGNVRFLNSQGINKLSSTRTVAYSILITSGATLTVGQFDIRGTAGNIVTVQQVTTTNAILASLGGAVQSNIDYVTFNNITATPTPTATGTVPYYWYVGTNSTQNINSTGLIFSSDTSYTYYNLTSGTSWSVPANWNNSDNNVYMIGGGGGGSGSVVASSTGSHNSGSGGGGGGFTALTNTTLTAGGTVSYAIGAAGAVGAGSTSASTAGSGGTTTFNISNTAGGGGGAATGLGTRTAGTAGTGSTFNGGTGGLGTAPGTNTTNAGGGGAGSGGLNGAGVNGGANSGATIGAGGAGNNNLGDYLFVSGARYGDGGNGGATAGAGVAATGFGGGGGGGGTTANSGTTRAGALGTQGVIVVRYRLAAAGNTSNFLTFFYQ